MSDISKYKSILDFLKPMPTELGMLAKWGSQQDNAMRNMGSQIQSPAIALDSPLNFEQRVLNPNAYPAIDNGDGSKSTHRMAYGEVDGQFVAFPTIVQLKDGKLAELGGDEAFRHAMDTGEYRAFGTDQEAASYAEGGYKKFWGLGEKRK